MWLKSCVTLLTGKLPLWPELASTYKNVIVENPACGRLWISPCVRIFAPLPRNHNKIKQNKNKQCGGGREELNNISKNCKRRGQIDVTRTDIAYSVHIFDV